MSPPMVQSNSINGIHAIGHFIQIKKYGMCALYYGIIMLLFPPTWLDMTQIQVNLSNILDVMPKGDHLVTLFKLVASKCNGGARIAHWGLYDPNPWPRTLEEQGLLVSLSDLASHLFEQDRLFYSAFHLNEIPQK